jgi:regulator of sigma E protease
MTGLGGTIGLIFDLLLVILGFGLIIFIHELGHFLAAKWAGIRVLAFAIGFGPALCSYRKGMGVRLGTSEPQYVERAQKSGGMVPGVSPTEYRLNYLPLGGYVKMLGQEDLNPNATSAAPDSYQRCKPWKRMVVISAGVVMNIITAAILFIAVFMYGLQTEPPTIGLVHPGSPAAAAVAQNASVEAGLRPGDRVLEINGREPSTFNDLVLAAAMTRRDTAMHIAVDRHGFPEPIIFQIQPKAGERTRLMEIGVEPARSAVVHEPTRARERDQFAANLAGIGLTGVEPGMRLTRIGANADVRSAEEYLHAVRNSGGEPIEAEFVGDEGQRAIVTIQPQPALQLGHVRMPSGAMAPLQHLLGLTPVMKVAPGSKPAQGLEIGDIFARIGAVEYPGLAQGIAEIHRHYGQEIDITVLRPAQDGSLARIELRPKVHRRGNGQIGFAPGDTAESSTLLSVPPPSMQDERMQREFTPAAASIITRPGVRIVSIAGQPVGNFAEIRAVLRAATADAVSQATAATISLVLELPLPDQPGGARPTETIEWTLAPEHVRALHDLGWTSPFWAGIFELESFVLRADGPIEAVRMGVAETHRVMMMTYITFARLFQGTVRVEHLKGPVGIAHMGIRIAERGFIWMLFFMALISVNLAVINFLPLPIVDGGQFLFLVAEQIRGKPVPVVVQNVATLAGLLLIGAVFIIVTFHDITNLFG